MFSWIKPINVSIMGDNSIDNPNDIDKSDWNCMHKFMDENQLQATRITLRKENKNTPKPIQPEQEAVIGS